jgi:hypothetical protein
MMFLLGCFEYEGGRQQVEDPSHPDAEHLLETEHDRERRAKFMRFFGNRGAKNMKIENFEWGWSIDMNPCYLGVSATAAILLA